jgi:hypothetical protein
LKRKKKCLKEKSENAGLLVQRAHIIVLLTLFILTMKYLLQEITSKPIHAMDSRTDTARVFVNFR